MAESHDAQQVPKGFRLATGLAGAFVEHCGPVYGRVDNGHLVLGFRVAKQHVNPLNICHGGMLATFADVLLACSAMYQPEAQGRILPTISLQLDFFAAAPLGAWVEGRATILRATRSMIFSHGSVNADGTPVTRISGISKIGPRVDDSSNIDPLALMRD